MPKKIAAQGPSPEEWYVRSVVGDAGEKAADLCVLALERALRRDGVAIREPDAAGGSPTVDPSVDAVVRHVVDWIVAAVANGDAWLARTDRDGRPVKLTKIGSLARAKAEADKAMRRFASTCRSVAAVEGDEVVEAELGDGWTVVRLLTPAALDRESGAMDHCIGDGAYDRHLASGKRVYLSLRDPHGAPHVTFELPADRSRLMQAYGPENSRPRLATALRYREWLRGVLGPDHVPSDNLFSASTGWVVDAAGRRHGIDDLPDRIHLAGPLDVEVPDGFVMPTELLQVSPSGEGLSVVCAGRMTMPSRLVAASAAFRGDLVFDPSGSVVVEHVLDLTGSTVRGLALGHRPSRIAGDFAGNGFCPARLDLTDCSFPVPLEPVPLGAEPATQLPPGMVVGEIVLSGSDVVAIPRDASVWHLDLKGSMVSDLPRGFAVRTLVVRDCALRRLPAGLKVEGELRVGRRCGGVDRLPVDAVVKSVRLDNAATRDGVPFALPEGLVLEGSLEIVDGAGIPLPDGMRIGGMLYVEKNADARLPRNLKVGGWVMAGDVDVLPAGLEAAGVHLRCAADEWNGAVEEDVRLGVGMRFMSPGRRWESGPVDTRAPEAPAF